MQGGAENLACYPMILFLGLPKYFGSLNLRRVGLSKHGPVSYIDAFWLLLPKRIYILLRKHSLTLGNIRVFLKMKIFLIQLKPHIF